MSPLGQAARRVRRLVARTVASRDGARAGAPRIAFIGNCQVRVMARAARLLAPDAVVDFTPAGDLHRWRSAERFAAAFARHDHVFAQPIGLSPEHLTALACHRGYAPVPNVVFAAFHPDLVYVGGPGQTAADLVRSPVGHYHSALVLYAYLAGFAPDRALRLFDGELYRHLGYLDLWDYAADTLLTLGRGAGLDLEEPLARWTRRGLFMHSTNHPRAFVLADLARLLLERAGLSVQSFDLDSYLVDDLALQGMWPVYEPIARRYGVPGGEMFLSQRRARRPRSSARLYALPDFVEASYAAYAATPRVRLANDRVETWLRSDDMRRLFADWTA